MATKTTRQAPNDSHYDTMFLRLLSELTPAYGERMAERDAWQQITQRREADLKALGWPSHWPTFETPREHNARDIRTRRDTGSADSAAVALFTEDVQAWRAAEPTWSAHEITIHIMDRGYYCRYGYAWGLRIAQRLIA